MQTFLWPGGQSSEISGVVGLGRGAGGVGSSGLTIGLSGVGLGPGVGSVGSMTTGGSTGPGFGPGVGSIGLGVGVGMTTGGTIGPG